MSQTEQLYEALGTILKEFKTELQLKLDTVSENHMTFSEVKQLQDSLLSEIQNSKYVTNESLTSDLKDLHELLKKESDNLTKDFNKALLSKVDDKIEIFTENQELEISKQKTLVEKVSKYVVELKDEFDTLYATTDNLFTTLDDVNNDSNSLVERVNDTEARTENSISEIEKEQVNLVTSISQLYDKVESSNLETKDELLKIIDSLKCGLDERISNMDATLTDGFKETLADYKKENKKLTSGVDLSLKLLNSKYENVESEQSSLNKEHQNLIKFNEDLSNTIDINKGDIDTLKGDFEALSSKSNEFVLSDEFDEYSTDSKVEFYSFKDACIESTQKLKYEIENLAIQLSEDTDTLQQSIHTKSEELFNSLEPKLVDIVEERAIKTDREILKSTTDLVRDLTKSIKGEVGEKGDTGYLDRVQTWTAKFKFLDKGVVRHNGGTYQALSDTYEEPSDKAEDWVLIANGISSVKVNNKSDITKLEVIVTDSEGKEHVNIVDLPVPKIYDTYEPKKKYKFYDSVLEDGSRWIARTSNPRGTPSKSPDWALQTMRGNRGQRGLKGDTGETGHTIPVSEIIDEIRTQDAAEMGDGVPIKRWLGKWVFGGNYKKGDVVNFETSAWICTNDDDSNGEVAPSNMKNKHWTPMYKV